MSDSDVKIILLIRDPVLLALCCAELHAMGFSDSEIGVEAEGSLHFGTNVAMVVDLDDGSFSLPAHASDLYVIGISRKETDLPPSIKAACRHVLHRPFSIDTFQMALRVEDTAHIKAEPSFLQNQKRRRMTAKKSSPKSAQSHLLPNHDGSAVFCGNAEIPLTPGEATVFLALFRADGETVSREELSSLLNAKEGSNLSDVHICAIRKKLAPFGADTKIAAVRKQGYRLLKS